MDVPIGLTARAVKRLTQIGLTRVNPVQPYLGVTSWVTRNPTTTATTTTTTPTSTITSTTTTTTTTSTTTNNDNIRYWGFTLNPNCFSLGVPDPTPGVRLTSNPNLSGSREVGSRVCVASASVGISGGVPVLSRVNPVFLRRA